MIKGAIIYWVFAMRQPRAEHFTGINSFRPPYSHGSRDYHDLFRADEETETQLKEFVYHGTGRARIGPGVPQLWSPSARPCRQDQDLLFSPAPQCTDRETEAQEGTHSLTRLPSMLGCLLGSPGDGWAVTGQETLETMVIDLPTWEKATCKSPECTGLCTNSSCLLGLPRLEEQLLWLVARGRHHRKPSTPTASMDPQPTQP